MKIINIVLLCLVFPAVALANGGDDHSHEGEKGAGLSSALAQPKIETATETFELVGRLQAQNLALFIDRFETNEPVLNAGVEVEVNGAKAQATFRADQGDYLVDDKALMSVLAKPGKHSLVFTIAAGNESDLLEGTIQVSEDVHASTPSVTSRYSPSTLTLLALLFVGVSAIGVAWKNRRKKSTRN